MAITSVRFISSFSPAHLAHARGTERGREKGEGMSGYRGVIRELRRQKDASEAMSRASADRRARANRATNAIIEHLFVNGEGKQADRLVLTSIAGHDLGGYSKDALIARIREIIQQAFAPGK